jgi:polysaccharide biosynthesis/export protein
MKKCLIFIPLISLFFTSCITFNKLRYFQDVDSQKDIYDVVRAPKPIQAYDKLYIKVFGIDEKSQRVFNANDGLGAFSDGSLSSYIVNDKGEISFPFVGLIILKGLTVDEAGKKIKAKLSEYLSNIDVTVKYIGNSISILGEVNRQGEFTYGEDKINIFQALGMAGGLTRYGNRRTVVVMRKTENKVEYHNVDLSDKKVVQNECFYLFPGDVIIVEPLKAIAFSYQNTTYSNILATFTTFASIVSAIYIIKSFK